MYARGESPCAEERPVTYSACKCSAGHADWGMLTGRHPAPQPMKKRNSSGRLASAGLFFFKKKPAWFHAGDAVMFRSCSGKRRWTKMYQQSLERGYGGPPPQDE